MDIFLWILALFIIVSVYKAVRIVPQGFEGLIERFGKYSGSLEPGLKMVIPWLDIVRLVDKREQVIMIPEQQVITRDNVGVTVDGIVYVQIMDAAKSVYSISNVMSGVINLAQTSLRSVLGTMALDETLSNRETINGQLLMSLDQETEKWGIKVMRVEIKRLDPPSDIQDSMSKQMKAERERRASILEADGYKQSLIARSEGDKQSQILRAEGEQQAQILKAEGEAQAKIRIAQGTAKALELESLAAQQFFSGNAIAKEQLKVMENALMNNTKYVLDTDFLGNLSKFFHK